MKILFHYSGDCGCGCSNPCEKKVYRGICLSDVKVCVNKYTELGITPDSTLEQLIDAILSEIENATGSNGLSAYELWLSEGNTGSISDFLDSLKGNDGADGNDGLNGADGTRYTISNIEPITKNIGDIWEHTSANVKKVWNGTSWIIKDSIQEKRILYNLGVDAIRLNGLSSGDYLLLDNILIQNIKGQPSSFSSHNYIDFNAINIGDYIDIGMSFTINSNDYNGNISMRFENSTDNLPFFNSLFLLVTLSTIQPFPNSINLRLTYLGGTQWYLTPLGGSINFGIGSTLTFNSSDKLKLILNFAALTSNVDFRLDSLNFTQHNLWL